jgi:hypothetical protein
MLRSLPFISNFIQHFYYEGNAELIKYLFCIYWNEHMVFLPYSIDIVCHIP